MTLRGAQRVLIAIGGIFVLNGLTVSVLRITGAIPRGFTWHGPVFLLLGAAGVVTAALGLRSFRLRPLVLLSLLYIPWTLLGLVGDCRRGIWPLVAGELLGLCLALWALVSAAASGIRSER